MTIAGAAAPVSQCGGNKGVYGVPLATTTICTKAMPFRLSFISDQFEFTNEAPSTAGSQGFKIKYFLNSC